MIFTINFVNPSSATFLLRDPAANECQVIKLAQQSIHQQCHHSTLFERFRE